MKTIKVFLLIILVSLSFFLVSCGNDVKVVLKLPQGFIKLSGRGVAPRNILIYEIDEEQVLFKDAAGTCIYQTALKNNAFIVKFENNYYVNEEKYLELFDTVTVAHVVKELPSGFALLRTAGDALIFGNGGLHYKFEKSQILFLDAYETCIYQTELSNSEFIVVYDFDYYIDYKKYSELVDIATSAQIVQTKPDGFIKLYEALGNQKCGLTYTFFEKVILILDADGNSIYETLVYDKNFLIVFEGEYYVNEKIILEIAAAKK